MIQGAQKSFFTVERAKNVLIVVFNDLQENHHCWENTVVLEEP